MILYYIILYNIIISLPPPQHVNNFPLLILGRVLGGLSTSLLFTAFESWMVISIYLSISISIYLYIYIVLYITLHYIMLYYIVSHLIICYMYGPTPRASERTPQARPLRSLSHGILSSGILSWFILLWYIISWYIIFYYTVLCYHIYIYIRYFVWCAPL